MSKDTNKLFGALAEFEDPKQLFAACEQVRDAGYTNWDAHTPFPVHGLEKAMGLKPSKIGYVAFCTGFAGAGGGLLLQWWTSAKDYPLVISGKPLFSWPAFVPICFELMVLFAVLGAFLGLLHFARLPRPYHALFRSKRFEQVTDDRFFISIEATDPKFDEQTTAKLLKEAGAHNVEMLEE